MTSFERIQQAADQLMRYGGDVQHPKIIDVLELLVEINDDIWNGRDWATISVSIDDAIKALRQIENECGT